MLRPFTLGHAPEGTEEHVVAETLAAAGLGSYVITSLILVVPLTYLIRSRLYMIGTATLLVTSIALLSAIVENLREPETAIAALAAARLTDLALLTLRHRKVSQRVGRIFRSRSIENGSALWG